MAFPPAHMLVGAGVATVVATLVPIPPRRAALIAAVLAALPDADFVVGLATGQASAYHGTFTHSITATLLIALLAGVAANSRWALLAGAAYGSHLLVDLLDDRGRTNVLLWWPWTQEQAFAIAPVFPTVPFEQGRGIGQAALSLLQPDVFGPLLLQTAYGFAALLLLLALAWLLRHRLSSGPERV